MVILDQLIEVPTLDIFQVKPNVTRGTDSRTDQRCGEYLAKYCVLGFATPPLQCLGGPWHHEHRTEVQAGTVVALQSCTDVRAMDVAEVGTSHKEFHFV